MKTFKLLLIMFVLSGINSFAQKHTTYTYFENDTISLKLDLFVPKKKSKTPTPILIYVHGGGFAAGNRKNGHSLAKHLRKQDIATASITYTLHMKDKSFSCDGILPEKVKAIQIAANQLWLATNYILKNSEALNIDPTQVFIGGSSAGAETVLHAAYWNRNQMQLFDHQLPKTFQYKGVIAGAGAIMDLSLITTTNAIPLFAFHGNQDKTVPYSTAAHHYCQSNATGWLMLFGSESICKHLEKMNISHRLDTFNQGGHSFADAYIYKNHDKISDFINKTLTNTYFREYYVIPSSDK